jgi:hypothetical protein
MLKLLKSKKLLFASFIACASCNTLKKPPPYDLCSAVWRQNLEESYGFCLPSGDGKEYRISSSKIFQEKYVMISVDDYGEIRAYVEYLKRQAEKRCK